ncbi:hypothetical protein M422DRAFT_23858 [Sphaerobolus stellatus SS14]|nr:hypothetical protein M422DRAFT_23858 [Sphaerobolus stellatus SS14]
MRQGLLFLAPLLASVLAVPPHIDLDGSLPELQEQAQAVFRSGSKAAQAVFDQFETWVEDGREFLKNKDNTYFRTTHSALSDKYQLRTNIESPTLCDSTVKQQSGYLDVDENNHFFFWFFESRTAPETAPLILWLNGGPGCSSSGGILFELGPCRVSDGGQSTVYNNHSWNEFANIVFLDQPANVGYSYSSDGTSVNNTPDAAVDVWAFLELFLKQFPQYAKLPFHIAAESYGGHYAPNIASVVHKKNQELALAPIPNLVHINLHSVVLANGITEPFTQFASIPEFACEGPHAVYDDPDGPECQALRTKVPTCQRLVQACYDYESRFTCVPASVYCNAQLLGPLQQLGLNPYDVRKTCNKATDGDLCYKEMDWVDAYLNRPEVKKALGAPSNIDFQSCNLQINQAFLFQGDTAHNSAKLLPELLNAGIRLMVYAGQADSVCNFIGNHNWMEKLDGHPFHEEFGKAKLSSWVTLEGNKEAGQVRSAGPAAGNYTYVAVKEAGHMVPFDQPEAALDLMSRWILNIPLSFANGSVSA